MSTPDMTTILTDLAAGRIDPSEAAKRIDAISAQRPPSEAAASSATSRVVPIDETAPDEAPTAAAADAPADDAWASATDRPQSAGVASERVGPEPVGVQSAQADVTADFSANDVTEASAPVRPRPISSSGVERISVRAVGRRVRIVGEPSVATVAADGPHVLRRNGSVLEISSDGELGASIDGFTLLRSAPRTLDDFRSLGLGKELFLRVNPAIVVDVEVTAGSLNTEGVPVLGKVRVTAGGAKLLDVQEAADVLVQAGQATVKGAIRTGRSRIRAESGSLNVVLADDSNVTVHADAQLGKVSWSGGHSGAGDEVVMGAGAARLDIEVVMGHAQVRVGSTSPARGAA